MEIVWKCDFCNETFPTRDQAEMHEMKGGSNPQNKVTDKIILRLADVLYDLPDIIAAALVRQNSNIEYLLAEVKRAGTRNCPFMVYKKKDAIISALYSAETIADSRKGLRTTKEQDIEKDYPELLEAFLKTLTC